MKNKFRIVVIYSIIFCLNWSCSKNLPIKNPTVSTLLKPEKNNACVPVSTTELTGVVSFQWSTSQNTDSYTIIVKNSITNAEVRSTVNRTETTFTLERGAPYSWWVVSDSNASTISAKSEIWNFYLEGFKEQTHLPFPAQIITPAKDATVTIVTSVVGGSTVRLGWIGSDLDNDISSYQIYLGTTSSTLSMIKDNFTSSTFSASVEKGKTYYWQIVTIDKQGNQSKSSIWSFKTSS